MKKPTLLKLFGFILGSYLFLVSITVQKFDSSNPSDADSIAMMGQRFPERNSLLPRVLVIVFPQFHSDPLNDKMWGKDFTDWENLRSAPEKNRLGYAIPRPTELGYYNYTHTEPRKKQGELARQYGVDGFVFHHYWFYDDTHPGPNLHKPLMNMLQDGYPNIPFCLHWCAIKWTDTWHGKTVDTFDKTQDGILQNQYFPKNASDPAIKEHYNWLSQFFQHPNYIKVQGKPVFMMYQKKPGSFTVLRELRRLAMEDGFPGLYFTVGLSKSHNELFPNGSRQGQWHGINHFPRDVFTKTVAYPQPLDWMSKQVLKVPEWCEQDPIPKQKRSVEIAGILSSFDNTPRRDLESANLWSADDPKLVALRFHDSLYAALYYEACCFPHEYNANNTYPADDDRFILINSMNEWAEGMALEPSNVFGRKLLEAVRNAKASLLASGCKKYAHKT